MKNQIKYLLTASLIMTSQLMAVGEDYDKNKNTTQPLTEEAVDTLEFFDNLPLDIQKGIVSNLDNKSLCRLARTSKHFNSLSNDEHSKKWLKTFLLNLIAWGKYKQYECIDKKNKRPFDQSEYLSCLIKAEKVAFPHSKEANEALSSYYHISIGRYTLDEVYYYLDVFVKKHSLINKAIDLPKDWNEIPSNPHDSLSLLFKRDADIKAESRSELWTIQKNPLTLSMARDLSSDMEEVILEIPIIALPPAIDSLQYLKRFSLKYNKKTIEDNYRPVWNYFDCKTEAYKVVDSFPFVRFNHDYMRGFLMTELPSNFYFEFLETLVIDGYGLLSLPDSVAKMKNLAKVTITNTDIAKLPNGFLSDLNRLRKLDLSHNKLRSLESEWNLPEIKKIDLSHNEIENTSLWTLNAPKLKKLDLSRNSMKELPPFLNNFN